MLREETPKVDAEQPRRWGRRLLHYIAEVHPPRRRGGGGRRRRWLHHNVPAPGHLSTPITDFGKGQPRRRLRHSHGSRRPRRRGIALFFAAFVRNARRADAIVATHRWKLARISHCSSKRLHRRRIESSSPAPRRFYYRDFFAACLEFSEQLSALLYGLGCSSKRDVVLSSRF